MLGVATEKQLEGCWAEKLERIDSEGGDEIMCISARLSAEHFTYFEWLLRCRLQTDSSARGRRAEPPGRELRCCHVSSERQPAVSLATYLIKIWFVAAPFFILSNCLM